MPYIWENQIHGVDFGFLRHDPNIKKYQRRNYQCRYVSAAAIDYFLCNPVAGLSFDLNEWTSNTKLPKTIEAARTVIRDGSMDGWCVYFRVILTTRSVSTPRR